MKLGDLVSRVVIDSSKLSQYALNPQNERGRHKAKVFEQTLGFTQRDHSDLAQQIENSALEGEAEIMRADRFGQHVRVDLDITGVAGQRAVVRTGWLITPNSDEAVLVTLYVRR